MSPAKQKAEIKTAKQVRDEGPQYPKLVVDTAARTGFHPYELVYKTFKNQDTGEITEVVYPNLGARLRKFHEDHAYDEDTDKPDGWEPPYIRTRILDRENVARYALVEAEIRTKNGTFQDLGSATVTRDKRLEKTILELAHSRAVSRTLRLAGYGIEFDDAEGLVMEHEAAAASKEQEARQSGAEKAASNLTKQTPSPPAKNGKDTATAADPPTVEVPRTGNKCETCEKAVSPSVATLSKQRYAKVLCTTHFPPKKEPSS